MKATPPEPIEFAPHDRSRRRFVTGLAVGGALGALGLVPAALAKTPRPDPLAELQGSAFDLEIVETPVNFTGRPAIAATINGQLPGPVLRWREGDELTLRVHNRLRHSTSIHWHGIILPPEMDGVPGLSFAGIAPGDSFTYRFRPRQGGTYWYHSHSGFQEQLGHYGALVIEPREPEPFSYQRDYVVVLSDWTDEDPKRVFAKLKKREGYYNYSQLTLPDFLRQAKAEGWRNALASRAMWERMRMNPRDLADVSAATYTYLMNGTPPVGNWTGLFRPGERVRLRFINAAAMTYFDLRIPGLKLTVIAADGQNVRPVEVEEIRIGVAETYDVLVEPDADRAYTLFAQSADRSGFACGTLAPRAGMNAPVPAPDPTPTLAMSDMGMAHDMGGMDHGAMDHAAMGHAAMGHAAMPQDHAATVPADELSMAGMTLAAGSDALPEHGGSSDATLSMAGMELTEGLPPGAGGGMVAVAHHPAEEFGPSTDMRAELVSTRLDDPGVGLRGNGRRVLTYADLRSLQDPPDRRSPERTIELHLTGNMERYMWSFDGKKFSDAEPIRLRYGEMVRIRLVNDTMMEHPVHLHGMWSDIETPAGDFLVRKHTVSVKPGHAISFRVLADAQGDWAFHCHLIYHMKAGMFRKVVVA